MSLSNSKFFYAEAKLSFIEVSHIRQQLGEDLDTYVKRFDTKPWIAASQWKKRRTELSSRYVRGKSHFLGKIVLLLLFHVDGRGPSTSQYVELCNPCQLQERGLST